MQKCMNRGHTQGLAGKLNRFGLFNLSKSSHSYSMKLLQGTLSYQVLTPGQPASFTVMANQTATHAVPAILNSLSSALLRAITGDQDASIAVNNHPLATLAGEKAIAVSRETGKPIDEELASAIPCDGSQRKDKKDTALLKLIET